MFYAKRMLELQKTFNKILIKKCEGTGSQALAFLDLPMLSNELVSEISPWRKT